MGLQSHNRTIYPPLGPGFLTQTFRLWSINARLLRDRSIKHRTGAMPPSQDARAPSLGLSSSLSALRCEHGLQAPFATSYLCRYLEPIRVTRLSHKAIMPWLHWCCEAHVQPDPGRGCDAFNHHILHAQPCRTGGYLGGYTISPPPRVSTPIYFFILSNDQEIPPLHRETGQPSRPGVLLTASLCSY
jgi:hypothetical protein